MTLRSRLVLAVMALATAGLVAFGVVTYSLYRSSLERRIDDQLRAAVQPLAVRLDLVGGKDEPSSFPGAPGKVPGEGKGGGADGGVGFDSYAAIIGVDGRVRASIDPNLTAALPDLPDDVTATEDLRLVTTGSFTGSGEWRVLVLPLSKVVETRGRRGRLAGEGVMVVAAPTGGLEDQLDRLVRVEVAAATAALAALGLGAWLVLRRGLRPLEHMAASAATITAGDLTERVEPGDGRTEVGQLGLALNTMLDGIEASFREREATEARLRQFLADASHELRTPLTSIQGFAELFRLGADGTAVADGTEGADRADLPVIMRRIEQEAERMKVLVEDLLLLARLDQTRPFRPEPVDLTVLAADACSDVAAVAPDHPITLDAPVPVVVAGDVDHLRQAIANLVTNAVRHTPPGTAIEVAARADGDRATVTVRDHGPGLDDATKARVFDRFWQADPARAGAGSGLGLSIVAGIAEEHGGRATVADAPGGGAAFALELPRSPDDGGSSDGVPGVSEDEVRGPDLGAPPAAPVRRT
ncbi:MAG TPA: HAMP domain-containing sensor histidine kinase [Aquihabitans sp.]|jgi:two-component system OmpR family sensor kinase|nr:HAMP domain-containing sensor histidine kinase [Aquihabitans sp.]